MIVIPLRDRHLARSLVEYGRYSRCTSEFQRAYIRRRLENGRQTWTPIGWHCPGCKATVLDEELA